MLIETILEFPKYWSPRILIAASTVAFGLRVALGNWTIWDAAIVGLIILYWPIKEWLIHVFILHWKPFRFLGFYLDPLIGQKHREHHKDPTCLKHVFIPLHMYLWTLPTLPLFWFLILPTRELALSALAFDLLMSLQYEWAHYFVHTKYEPTSRYWKRLKINHRLHHYKNENYWFGVSMLFGDKLFRTAPNQNTVPVSPTARNLDARKTKFVSSR